ncbi:MAG: type II toxin-antitoxin system PemK/MazF family toxin [Phormidesmis sp.]
MPLAKGDIVLVPFPFTDLSQTKLRPAVVLWAESKGQDVTLCFVSSQKVDRLAEYEFVIASNDSQFSITGLKVTSKVRVTRIVTLERRLLQRRLGRLSDRLIERLDQALRYGFQLISGLKETSNAE